MKGTYLKYLLCTAATGLFLAAPVYAGAPMWTYSAPTPASSSITPGSTATVTYTVTNQSLKSKNLILRVTPGLHASACELDTRGSTCTLTLTINGNKVPAGGIHGGPILCDQGNPNQCYQPSKANALNITVANNPPPSSKLSMVAVGIYGDSGYSVSIPSSYYSPDNGVNWRFIGLPRSSAPANDNGLTGASCNELGYCATVGISNIGVGLFVPLSYYSETGGKGWHASLTEPPIIGSQRNFLNGVSCNAKNACAAVGGYGNATPQTFPLSYFSTDGGKNWAASTTLPPAIGTRGVLASVSCNDNGACGAVGSDNSGLQTLLLSYYSTDSGKNWISSSTMPPVQGGGSNALNGVSCNASGACAAVGFYDDGSRNIPLSYYSTDAGNNWILSTTLPAAQGVGANILKSVFCNNSGACSAVGYYNDGSQNVPLSFYSTDMGKTWLVSPTMPAGVGGTGTQLSSVACNRTGACSAVGNTGPVVSSFEYLGATPISYVSMDNGKNWVLSTTVVPAVDTLGSNVSSVS